MAQSNNTLYFITGNKSKFDEAQAILSNINLEQLDIDLPEIQEIDAHAVVKAKLEAALEHHAGPFIVDDVSVQCKALNGLPGPLIKWFLKVFSLEELYGLVEKMGNTDTEVSLLIGYARNREDVHFFEGVVRGKLVMPKGKSFGWDPSFLPEGFDKTYGEMSYEEKNKMSHRRLALDKLKEFLEKNPHDSKSSI